MDHDTEADGDDALLARVSRAFAPYLLPPNDLNNVRQSLRGYIAAQINATQNPGQGLEGLRAEYVKAVRAHRAAKSRYDSSIARDRERVTTSASNTAESIARADPSSAVLLGQHIELSRLQEQHARLVTLQDELNALARTNRRFTTLDIRSKTTSEAVSAYPDTEREVARLNDALTRSVKGLERAVVDAHQHATRERSLLQDVKTQRRSDYDGVTPQQKLHALLVTRRELTAWLEESLEKCQGSSYEARGQQEQTHDIRNETASGEPGQLLDEQYEQYLEARRRVLAVVSSLKSPLPELPQESPDSSAVQMTRRSAEIRWAEEIKSVNLIETILLPALQQQSASRALLTFATERQADELQSTMNMLDRLSDESQILLAFPLLARSGRFEHAASAFGKKHAVEDEPKDEVLRRLEPWLFAAEAAETAASGTIEAHVKRGKESMERFAQSHAELHLLREWNG
ncbi:hypothetical protein A1O1_07844 [Capronia coronata CBS 617.96]|uniref:Uncharacterized protein n=1 Tax=Capronia coronata CBS 617.96 TaxID=1182541 RepID=W9YHL8_9EURO|nr:uncharacterized protein A1O1_07844 [Capronia coronata CBS 617.96]EXJ81779.1 hypothetical protein A1O1_07844 [Capronia coronata CBS 617.96]